MTQIVKSGAGLLFMKVGTHAQESLEDIIARKSKEIEETGYGMWGYGGNTCHPRSMVQPFAEMVHDRGEPIYLLMEEMESKHFAEPVRADQFSVDGRSWENVPDTINVRGSRFALVLSSLKQQVETIPLARTRVPLGPSMGRLGSRYIRGRVDKACLEVLAEPELVNEEDQREIRCTLVAELEHPYAVFLRNRT